MTTKNDIRKEVLLKAKNLINIHFPNDKERMSKDFYNENELIHIRRGCYEETDTFPYLEDYYVSYDSYINDRFIVCNFYLQLYDNELTFCKSDRTPKVETSKRPIYKKWFFNKVEYIKHTNKDLIFVEKF